MCMYISCHGISVFWYSSPGSRFSLYNLTNTYACTVTHTTRHAYTSHTQQDMHIHHTHNKTCIYINAHVISEYMRFYIPIHVYKRHHTYTAARTMVCVQVCWHGKNKPWLPDHYIESNA